MAETPTVGRLLKERRGKDRRCRRDPPPVAVEPSAISVTLGAEGEARITIEVVVNREEFLASLEASGGLPDD